MGKGDDPNCNGSVLISADFALMSADTDMPQEVVAAAAATAIAEEVEQHAKRTRRANKPKRSAKRRPRREWTPEEQAAYKERVDAKVEELSKAVSDLAAHPERMEDWLRNMAKNRLWRYSYGNLMLAKLAASVQDPPFQPTRLASKTDWWKLGYYCKEGAHGLEILAPKTVGVWREKTDAAGSPIINPKTGEPVKVKVGERTVGFKVAKTFDISQMRPRTDRNGNPINKDLISANPVGAQQAINEMTQVAKDRGIHVFIGGVDDPDFPHRHAVNNSLLANPSAGGFAMEIPDPDGGEPTQIIATRAGLNLDEQARTLAHELAHATVHKGKSYDPSDPTVRERMEVEADGTAYVIGSFYGLPTDEQVSYVTHWARGKEEQHLKAATNTIQRAVRSIMEDVEKIRYTNMGVALDDESAGS